MKLRLDPNSTQPLHQQAEELLRTMIQQEEYKKGKLMPNEVELSKELNISRNTLRQAINRLVFEGLLIRKKGYGTTVAPQNVMSNARNWMSFSQEMHAQGMVVQNFELHISRKHPSQEAAAFLNAPEGTKLLCPGAFARTSGAAVRLFHLLFQSGNSDDGRGGYGHAAV